MPAHAISFDLVSYSRRLSNNFVVRCAFPSDSANIEDSPAIEFDTNSKNLQSRIADNCEEIVCFRPHFAHAHRMRFRSSARGLKQFDREWTVTTSIILPHENAYDVKNFLTSIAGHDNFNEETEHGLEILAHDDKLIARYENNTWTLYKVQNLCESKRVIREIVREHAKSGASLEKYPAPIDNDDRAEYARWFYQHALKAAENVFLKYTTENKIKNPDLFRRIVGVANVAAIEDSAQQKRYLEAQQDYCERYVKSHEHKPCKTASIADFVSMCKSYALTNTEIFALMKSVIYRVDIGEFSEREKTDLRKAHRKLDNDFEPVKMPKMRAEKKTAKKRLTTQTKPDIMKERDTKTVAKALVEIDSAKDLGTFASGYMEF